MVMCKVRTVLFELLCFVEPAFGDGVCSMEVVQLFFVYARDWVGYNIRDYINAMLLIIP